LPGGSITLRTSDLSTLSRCPIEASVPGSKSVASEASEATYLTAASDFADLIVPARATVVAANESAVHFPREAELRGSRTSFNLHIASQNVRIIESDAGIDPNTNITFIESTPLELHLERRTDLITLPSDI